MNNLKQRRIELRMSLQDLAEAAGVNRTTLTRIEESAPGVRPASVRAVEQALDKLDGRGTQEKNGAPGVRITIGDVTVEGPVEHIQALEEAAIRLAKRTRTAVPPGN